MRPAPPATPSSERLSSLLRFGAFAAGNNGSDPTSAIFNGRMLLFHGHGGSDTGPSHEYTEYSVMTSTTYRMGVRRAGGRGTIASGPALGAGVLRADASTGLSCGTRCFTTVLAGTRMWLHARPARGYRFVRWTGCNATRPRDFPVPLPDVKLRWVSATKNMTVTARFARA
ncbi:hypothetical protein AB0368_20450 [Actinoplanes sp. NPDC051475]|uniref:InlB B-repeat-containing protein n=1 Tax=Actinoplanes sp. NPDC051475 TaxID=3157225 RepID=UPI00344E4C36